MIDTHAHLYLNQFNEDRDAVVATAKASGVERILLPNIQAATTDDMLAMVTAYPNFCLPMMGLHPCYVKEDYATELAHVKEELATGKYIAVGEIGIDLYWDKSFLAEQKDAFVQQLRWAKEMKLPVAIHARESLPEIIELLQQEDTPDLKGVLHCFTGTLEQAKQLLDLSDFYLGVGGVVTFKKGGVAEVVKELSLDNLLLETDAPYLAPSPYRGKRNESSYLTYIADKLSDLFEVPLATVQQQTTANAKKLFQL